MLGKIGEQEKWGERGFGGWMASSNSFGYEFEQTPGHTEGRKSVCCSSWSRKESDMT